MMDLQSVCVLLVLLVSADAHTAPPAGLEEIHNELQQLRNITQEQAMELTALRSRLDCAEQQLKAQREAPKVAFAVSLGSNGLVSTKNSHQKLIYKDVLTNVGNAYSPETGVFKAPVRGVYFIRYTATAPTEGLMSAVLYKNGEVQLTVHEPPAGPGSDTASNGAALLLEQGDELYMQLLPNSHLWDNASHHSTFSGFLLYTM
ncbi:complement C1q-like protein 2 [Pygocentrus nattereri]|uniref:C1q domain-containing protein n=1 Tax=Pygocentrus nattereri TaxID=42514 RepID=A0AAR2JCJ8_PYGNA|nr:complement C1q-like protein 2 [Pygocentrus nattereri]